MGISYDMELSDSHSVVVVDDILVDADSSFDDQVAATSNDNIPSFGVF